MFVPCSCSPLTAFAVLLAPARSAQPTPDARTAPPKAGDEIVMQRTERSKTFELPSGGTVTRLYSQPVHYDSGSNGLQPIRNTLVPSPLAGYAVRNQANRFRADLPRRLSDPVRFRDGARWVRFALRGARAEAAVINGGVHYQDALEGTDVEYEMRSVGLKETLVLKSRAAAAPTVFDLEVSDGLKPEVQDDRSVAFKDGEKSAFGFAPPYMVDAKGAYSDDVSVALTRVGSAWRLTVTPSSTWLGDADRAFPVRLDPTIIAGYPYSRLIDSPADTFLSAAAPTTNYGQSTVNDVGASGTATRRSLLRYQVTEVLPWDRRAYSARFAAYGQSKDGTTGAPVTARPIINGFNEASATWNTRSTGVAWSTAGGDFASDATAPAPTQTVGTTGQWYFWDFRQMMDDWISRRRADHGFMLRGAEVAGTTPSTIFHFASAEAADQTREPYIDVYSEHLAGARDGDSFVELTPQGVESMYATKPVDAPAVQVNAATGNLMVHTNDAPAGTEGPVPLLLDRFYNSALGQNGGRFGGWNPGLDGFYLQADLAEGNVIFWGPSRTGYAFTRRADGTFAPMSAADSAATLVKEDEWRYVVTLDGQKFIFPCLDCSTTSYVAANGATATMNYEGTNRAQTFQTTAGTTRLKSNANGLVYEAVQPSGATHTYEYNSDRLLTKHTAPGNKVTTYAYDPTSWMLTEIRRPDGQILRFTWTKALGWWRVATMKWITDPATGAGTTTTFAYSFDTTGCETGSVVRTVQTRPDGQTVTYCVDGNREVLDMIHSSEESPVLEDILVGGYARSLNVSHDVAREALQTNYRADGLGEEVAAGAAGTGYAGVWFDEGQRKIAVGLTVGTDATPVHQALSNRGLTTASSIVRVASTVEKLEQERDRILDQLDDLLQAGVLRGEVRGPENDVLLETASSMTADQRTRVNGAIAGAAVKVTVQAHPDASFRTTLLRCDDTKACDPPLRGGIAYFRTQPTLKRHCTGAFVVRAKTTARTPYLLTAGHCIMPERQIAGNTVGLSPQIQTIAMAKGGDDDIPPQQPLNTVGTSTPYWHFGKSGDFGLVEINSTSPFFNALAPWVYVSRNPDQGPPPSGRTLRQPKYRIYRTTSNNDRGPVCVTGLTSGTKCGKISRLRATQGGVRSLAAVRLFDCDDDIATDHLQYGDSGGPAFIRGSARGIISSFDTEHACTVYISGATVAEKHPFRTSSGSTFNVDILPE